MSSVSRSALVLCRRQFVEMVQSAVERLDKESLATPLGRCPLVSAHFQRLLDKRSQLLVEDKLETVLAGVNDGLTTVTR